MRIACYASIYRITKPATNFKSKNLIGLIKNKKNYIFVQQKNEEANF